MNKIKYIDLELMSAEMGIDSNELFTLLYLYINEISEEIKCIQKHYSNRNWTDLQLTIHNIKGVSANMFIQSMYDAAQILDIKLKKNDLEDIEGYINGLTCVFIAVQEEIYKILNQNDSQ